MSFWENIGFGKPKTKEGEIIIEIGELQKQLQQKEAELRAHRMKTEGNVIPSSPINKNYEESLNQEIMGLREKIALLEAKKNQQS